MTPSGDVAVLMETDKYKMVLMGQIGVQAMTATDDGQLVSACSDETIRIWDYSAAWIYPLMSTRKN